ncbi:MAG: hypothetical protein APR54_04240 [Candidatus Cloacimonas sp. SDB]|nr:MAG: hypothetical protein APR54_04240 [Candidatus Cloacimonas sp. SDB]
MGKFYIYVILSALLFPLFADDIQQSRYIDVTQITTSNSKSFSILRDRQLDPPPEYSFILNGDGESTTYISQTWNESMPYGYNGHNVRIQPEISQPYGYGAGGIYVGYLYHPDLISCSRASFSYFHGDMTGNIFGTLGNPYTWVLEDVPSLDIDPLTGDPFFVYNGSVETDNSWDCMFAYDNFHLTGTSGYLKQSWPGIDNPEIGELITGNVDDEFLNPVVWIGSSPLEDHSRVHVYATNIAPESCYNIIYATADFTAADFTAESELDWTFRTFPELDNLNENYNNRIKCDMIADDNHQVAFFGSYGNNLFCLYSNDCGETFSFFTQEWLYPLDNPLREDGETYEFYDDDGITPSELVFCLSADGANYNGVFSADGSKILWMTGVNLNTTENIEQELYMAAYFYPKIFTFDISTFTFDFYDMDLFGAVPDDDNPMIPWDLNEDGEVDEYYDNGDVYIPLSMPTWYFDPDQGYQDAFFHENNFKMSANNNWIAAVWHDSKKLRNAYYGVDGFDGWYQQPEIAMSISDDSGESWSEILYINANPNDDHVDPDNNYANNYAPELEGMLPINVTLGEKLKIISNEPDDYHAQLFLAFFDDSVYSYGLSSGTLRLSSLCIEFQQSWDQPTVSEDEFLPSKYDYISNISPNPFNPSTKIEFYLSEDSYTQLIIYNLKGQKVSKLLDERVQNGHHSVIWVGKDDNLKKVPSGIYFCSLKTDKNEDVSKIILLK